MISGGVRGRQDDPEAEVPRKSEILSSPLVLLVPRKTRDPQRPAMVRGPGHLCCVGGGKGWGLGCLGFLGVGGASRTPGFP